jgi:FkbM family methyltransferase
MRKIFLDLGANNGCSVEKFIEQFPDSNEYEVYSFECNEKVFNILKNKKEFFNKKLKSFTPMQKAVWVNNMFKKFNGWDIVNQKIENDEEGVKCIDISQFIKDSFLENDYIVLKFDIEGAEYPVIEKMKNDGTLNYIDEIFGELHSVKKGYTAEDDFILLNTLKEYNLDLYVWCAQGGKKNQLKNKIYNKQQLELDYKKYEKRGMKINWETLKKYE